MSCGRYPLEIVRPATLLLILLGLCSGCDQEHEWEEVYPVQGKLLVDGKPAEGAVISFLPEEDASNPRALRSTAEVQADGTFRLSTYVAYDGAPAGPHVVTAYWPEPLPEGSSPIDVGTDQLQGRYADPAKPLARVTVQEGENVLEPFQVETK